MKRNLLFKSLFIFLAAVAVSGCQTTEILTDREKEIKTFPTDFREYADKGFLFMPDEYYGEYEVKGIINAELHPEVVYRKGEIPKTETYNVRYFWHDNVRYTKVTSIPDLSELIEYIYNLSLEWGGDAFTHFKASIEIGETDNNPNALYSYYSISGIVIKRKQ